MLLRLSIKDMPKRSVLEENGSSICVLESAFYTTSYPKHTHTFSELIIVIDGYGEYIVDKNSYKVEIGDVFAIT